MTFQYRTDPPSAEQFWRLFLTTGWNEEYHLSAEEYLQALRLSWYLVCVYEGERLVGFGRLVSDQVVHAMIYDLIVDPEFQNQGIGGEILDQLVQYCKQAQIRDIQLFCARGKRSFYEKRGFVARPADAPGMQFHRGKTT